MRFLPALHRPLVPACAGNPWPWPASSTVSFPRLPTKSENLLPFARLPKHAEFCNLQNGIRLGLQFAFDKGIIRIMATVAIYTAGHRRFDLKPSRSWVPPAVFAVTGGLMLGFYDGCFGPGAGAFWTVALVGLLGLELRMATGYPRPSIWPVIWEPSPSSSPRAWSTCPQRQP